MKEKLSELWVFVGPILREKEMKILRFEKDNFTKRKKKIFFGKISELTFLLKLHNLSV